MSTFWLAGWIFFLGVAVDEQENEESTWWFPVLVVTSSLVLWPYFLGKMVQRYLKKKDK